MEQVIFCVISILSYIVKKHITNNNTNIVKIRMQKQNDQASYIFKFIIIGDTGVGKSCLLLQFIDKRFRLKHQPTIGVEFGAKTMLIKNKSVKLQVWDTAGQQSFRSITRGYYRSAAGAILVYDVTNRDSFQSLSHWLTEARTSGNEDMSYILVANKCDLQLQRRVSYEQGEKFAKQNGMAFTESSAKTGYNVDATFSKVTQMLLNRLETGNIDSNNLPAGIKIGITKHSTFDSQNLQQNEQKRSKCCGS